MLQNSQNAERLIFRGKTKQATIADQCCLKLANDTAYGFGALQRSPHMIIRSSRLDSESLRPMPEKDFCNTIQCRADFAYSPKRLPGKRICVHFAERLASHANGKATC